MLQSLLLLALFITITPKDDELVRQVAAANAANLQSIESYYCKVSYSAKANGETKTPVAEYWRTKDSVRIHDTSSSPTTIDVKLFGGRSEQVTTSPGQSSSPNEIWIIFDDSRKQLSHWDVWQLNLFDLPVRIIQKPPLFIYNLSELVAVGKIVDAGWSRVNGKKLAHILIELSEGRRSYEVWVDPQRNWTIVHVIHRLADEEGRENWKLDYKIEDMKEILPSLFVPLVVSSSSRYKGRLVEESFIHFDDVRVNEPLPTIPPMPIPSKGSLAMDRVEGTVYRINEKGQRSSNLFRIGQDVSALGESPKRAVVTSFSRIWGLVSAVLAIVLFLAGVVLMRKSADARSR